MVQHKIGPDKGEASDGPILPFELSVDTKGTSGSPITATSPFKMGLHPGPEKHNDFLQVATNLSVGAELTATVDRGFISDSITGFTFVTEAEHVAPEPSTAIMLLTGLCLLFLWQRKRVLDVSAHSG